MNRLLLAFLTTAIFALIITPRITLAWGANGHRIVAKIGQDSLSADARAALTELAGTESLALLSNWPDYMRSFPSWDCAKPWHYATVEDNESFSEGMARPPYLSKSCNEEAFHNLGMPNNIVTAINYFAAIVAGDEDKTEAFSKLLKANNAKIYRDSVRLTALILVVHFVGDIHQPLHVGRGDDRGGNSITTQWFGELTKLHAVWDSELIDNSKLSYTEYASFLEQEFANQGPVNYGAGPSTWAQESISYRDRVYDIGDPRDPAANLPSLSYEYAATHEPLIKQRLYWGGKRLGELLNSILVNNYRAP